MLNTNSIFSYQNYKKKTDNFSSKKDDKCARIEENPKNAENAKICKNEMVTHRNILHYFHHR